MLGSWIAALFETVGTWVAEGAVVPVVGVYLVLRLGEVGISEGLLWLYHPEVLVSDRIPRSLRRLFERLNPAIWLNRLLVDGPGAPPSDWDLPTWHPIRLGVATVFVTVGVLYEEGLFRGLPLLYAPVLGVSPLWMVAFGTAWWAYLHGTGRAIALAFTVGWLYAALWLAGHGPIAVGLHLGTNLVATGRLVMTRNAKSSALAV